jgi:hypothetical protein
MKIGFIVFSGYNERAVIAFLRVLRQHHIDSFVVANGSDDRIFSTQFSDRVSFTRQSPELTCDGVSEALDAVRNNVPDHDLVLAPSSEALNRFFLANPRILSNRGIRFPLVSKELYLQISDKLSFSSLCRSCDIRVPEVVLYPEICALPFVAKPVSYDVADPASPRLVMTEKDRESLLNCPEFSKYYFQQFVEGRSVYLLLHISRNGVVHAFSQENLIQQPDGKSIIAAVASDFHLSEAAQVFIQMLKTILFHGLIMIEVRVNDAGCYMVEANPRFWGPSQFFVDAMSFDLFDAFLAHQGAELREYKVGDAGARYFWFEGLLETIKTGKALAFHNYAAETLAIDFSEWLASDIYRREDTMRLFSRIFPEGNS